MGNILPFNPVPQSQGLNARETHYHPLWDGSETHSPVLTLMRANTKNQNENQLNPGSRHGTMYLWDGSERILHLLLDITPKGGDIPEHPPLAFSRN